MKYKRPKKATVKLMVKRLRAMKVVQQTSGITCSEVRGSRNIYNIINIKTLGKGLCSQSYGIFRSHIWM